MTDGLTWVPVDACTLPTAEQPLRVAEFDALLANRGCRVDRRGPDRLRLTLVGGDELARQARELVVRETACCSFFEFDVCRAGTAIVIDVRVPPARAEVLDGLQRRAEATSGAGRCA